MKRVVKKLTAIVLAVVMVVAMAPLLGSLSGRTIGVQEAYAAQEITIQGGEFKISDLISGSGLTSEDTLVVGYGTTIVVDTDFSINQIKPLTTGPSLTINGDGALTVANGINLAQGSFVMESGTLYVTGPYPGINPNPAIYAGTVTINGGTANITFDDTTNPNQCGFRTPAFVINGGEARVYISGTGSGVTSGIYCQDSDGYATINNGYLRIQVKNSFGYPYGIYNATYPGYVVNIKGGTANIEAIRESGGNNYADARGITSEGLDFYQSAGSLTVDVTNDGQDVIGMTGEYFNISGGTLEITAVTSKEGRKGYGIRTDNDASFEMSGGNVTVVGKTKSSSSGEGVGIRYTNSDASKRMDISGGTLTATGTSNGIYVYNNTDNELSVQNQIYGTAKVTTDSYQEGIYGVRDAGWHIFGEAELTATSNERFGLYTNGPLLFGDTSVTTLETRGGWTRGVYADGGITIADTLEIANPSGGKVSADKKTIVDSSDTYAQKIGIQPKDVVKANVLFFDESTGQKITNPSLMVYKNDGPWQAGGEDPVRFSVGKEAPFTLTAGISTSGEYGTEYNNYEFVGWYKDGYPGTSPFSTNTTTPAQSITADTWYYAVFAPPKTEITSFTLSSDKLPLPGMTRNDKPTVTIAEEGVTITGVAWLDMDGRHLAEDYVFTPGDGVMLMIDYSVDKAYKLSGDIESNTTLNGGSYTGVHDVPNTAVYVYYTIPKNINTIDVGNIWTALDPVNKVPFTTEVHDELDTDGVNFNDKMEITNEAWTSGGEPDIKLSDGDSAPVPTLNRSYTHNVWLEAKDGWVFAPGESISIICGGTVHSEIIPVVSEDRKTAWVAGLAYANINPVDISLASVTGISNKTYNGSAQTQNPTVKMNINGTSVTLKSGNDYTLSYKNNTSAGTATVTITGKGNYTGTITKTFKILPLFKDVPVGHQFYDPIYWMAGECYTTGWDDGTFRPWNTCNRAACVTFLWRMAGEPEPHSIAKFSDMPENNAKNQDFRKAISWAVEEGITTGWSDNTFRPWRTCNRAAIMTFIWRYAGEPSASKSKFKDPTGNKDFDTAIAWASEKGIANGYSDGTFGPWKDCNRAAIAAFLYRYGK